MIAHVERSSGASVVITVDNLAYIVHESVVPSKRPGTEFELSVEDMLKATAFGIDMHVIFPDGICIDMEDFQRRLIAAGVITLTDLKKNPSVINRILSATVNSMSAHIYKSIKIAMEDYNV